MSDDGWRRAYGRVEGEEGAELVREFNESGMAWLANRVLHPFGWALGVVEDDDGAPVGLGVQKTSDAEGIVQPADVEIPARRRFLERVGRELPPPAGPEEGVVPTACPSCGWRRYRKTPAGAIPPSGETVTYVEPHELAGGATAVACGNPRCPGYEPVVRGAPPG